MNLIINSKERNMKTHLDPKDWNKLILLVIDDAYFEYMTQKDYVPGLKLFKNNSNVFILRTFSKVYGLASLRVGWGYGPKKIIDELEVLVNNASSFYPTPIEQASQNELGLPLELHPGKNTLVVDDINDTGHTLSKAPGAYWAVLHNKALISNKTTMPKQI